MRPVNIAIVAVIVFIVTAVVGNLVSPRAEQQGGGYQPLGCGQNVHSYAIARDNCK